VPELGVEYPLKGNYSFQICTTYHRVPSQGYTIFERKKRLKSEYQDFPPAELGRLRHAGKVIDDHFNETVLSFSGDTKIEFLDSAQVRQSRVIVMEVTYWDKKKSVENAREWGHIHLDELILRLETLKCERLVLIHASARYSTRDLLEIIDDRIPEHWKDRIAIFPRPT
jgi:ribonuclease Z